MTDKNEYTIEEHNHRFAVWTAARAATRGMKGGTTENVKKAIRHSGLRSIVEVENIDNPISSFEAYLIDHDKYCKKIIDYFKSIGIQKDICTYGRAAKIIAIYIKTRILNIENHRLMNFAFPPIDSILLENLAKKFHELNDLKKVKWTKLDEVNYNKTIKVIDDWRCNKNIKMWEIEKYWSPVR